MDERPGEWIETTEAMWQHMLEVVPPRAQVGNRFLVGEALRHDASGKAVHSCFIERDNRYFAKNMTVAEFHTDAFIDAYYSDRANGVHAAKAP